MTPPSKPPARLGLVGKIVRGGACRGTRAHTERGTSVKLKPVDAALAISTAAVRQVGYFAPLPLWAADARRYLNAHIVGALS